MSDAILHQPEPEQPREITRVNGGVRRYAQIEGEYRYWLERSWDRSPVTGWPLDMLTFVMLNPSTADGRVDDPTIRRCIGFARREGASVMQVVNLYALRSTDPAEAAAIRLEHPRFNIAHRPRPSKRRTRREPARLCAIGEEVFVGGRWLCVARRSVDHVELVDLDTGSTIAWPADQPIERQVRRP